MRQFSISGLPLVTVNSPVCGQSRRLDQLLPLLFPCLLVRQIHTTQLVRFLSGALIWGGLPAWGRTLWAATHYLDVLLSTRLSQGPQELLAGLVCHAGKSGIGLAVIRHGSSQSGYLRTFVAYEDLCKGEFSPCQDLTGFPLWQGCAVRQGALELC